MKPSLADQLKVIKIDFSEYGYLPMREDVILIDNYILLMEQWKKLNYIRKNLKILERYLHSKNIGTVKEWLAKNNENVSQVVFQKIGNHNNETGGISAYYLNLQQFHDNEEKKYDDSEEKAKGPDDVLKNFSLLRKIRKEKQKNRAIVRKEKLKDLEKDGKGYLLVVIEEPQKIENVTGKESDIKETGEKITNNTKKIGIAIAGTIIFISVMALVLKKSE